MSAISGRNYNPGVDWPVGQPRIIPDRSIAEPSILIANCFRASFVSSWPAGRPAGDVTRGSLQRCTTVQRLQIARILPLRVLRIVRPPTFQLARPSVHPSIHPSIVSGSTLDFDFDPPALMTRTWNLWIDGI